MARFVRGDVVSVPFPADGSSGAKARPALIVAAWPSGDAWDYLACVIASEPPHDPHFLELTPDNFTTGGLGRIAYVRPSYLFAVDEASITRRTGTLTADKLDAVLSTLAALFR